MRLEALALIAPLALFASCSNEPAPPKQETQAPSPAPMTAMPHGDHRPRHGGIVLMDEDLHFEVVFDPAGHHRVYLTDAVRAELPASAASQVSITVLRPGGAPPEALSLQVDEYGESWVAEGAPVKEKDARALVSLTYQGAPYEIELPFSSEPPDPTLLGPHATPPK